MTSKDSRCKISTASSPSLAVQARCPKRWMERLDTSRMSSQWSTTGLATDVPLMVKIGHDCSPG